MVELQSEQAFFHILGTIPFLGVCAKINDFGYFINYYVFAMCFHSQFHINFVPA